MRFERPWKVWEALEFWEAWKEALEGGCGWRPEGAGKF